MVATVAQTKNLGLLTSVNGFGYYRYDSLDANSLVDIDGYFNNNNLDQNLVVGDLIYAVDWDTAVRSGTIAGHGWHIVMAVAANGDVDLAEALAGNITNID